MRTLATCVTSVVLLAGCSTGSQEMVLVEGGSFQMGNTYDGGDPDEKPVHQVELGSFRIARCELTVGQFTEFVEATGYVTSAERDGGAKVIVGRKAVDKADASWRNVYRKQDDTYPVVCVSWCDAVEYCNWRSRKEGLQPCYSGSGTATTCDFTANGYRLPTEAEWEYAARSRGRQHQYAWGNGDPYVNGRPAANLRDETSKTTYDLEKAWDGYDDGYADASPVGRFAPSPLGIHDIRTSDKISDAT